MAVSKLMIRVLIVLVGMLTILRRPLIVPFSIGEAVSLKHIDSSLAKTQMCKKIRRPIGGRIFCAIKGICHKK